MGEMGWVHNSDPGMGRYVARALGVEVDYGRPGRDNQGL